MYFNYAKCDIYIGTGAGKKLMEEIAQARKSVKIVSPFLSAQLVQGLIQLQERGVDVELITIEEGQSQNGVSLRSLIRQQIHVDGKASVVRKLLKNILRACYGFGAFGLFALWWFFTQQDLKSLLTAFGIMAILTLTIFILRYSIRTKRVYSYSYRPLFPVKIIHHDNEFGQRTTYLHSKIYIIDESIAYLGSLNFTRSGTEYNHETRVRITDGDSVQKIVEEFHYLMDEANFPEVDFQALGSDHFFEPIH